MKTNFWKVFLCALFLGGFGVHRFILGKTKSGIIQLITLGGLGIWTLIDLIQILRGKFKDAAGNIITNPKPKTSWAIAIFVILVALGASSSSDSTDQDANKITQGLQNSPMAQRILILNRGNAYASGKTDGLEDAKDFLNNPTPNGNIQDFIDLKSNLLFLTGAAQPKIDPVVLDHYQRGWVDGANSAIPSASAPQ